MALGALVAEIAGDGVMPIPPFAVRTEVNFEVVQQGECAMKRRFRPLLGLMTMGCLACAAVRSGTGAKGSGSGALPRSGRAATVPNSSNNVYIGSTYPTGAAAVATVTLTANESASYVYLGNGSGTGGTLDLAGNTLTIGNDSRDWPGRRYGDPQRRRRLVHGANVYVENGNGLELRRQRRRLAYLQLSGGSNATTTAATGNVTGSSEVYTGSTLNLGTDLNLTGSTSTCRTAARRSTWPAIGHRQLSSSWAGTAPRR